MGCSAVSPPSALELGDELSVILTLMLLIVDSVTRTSHPIVQASLFITNSSLGISRYPFVNTQSLGSSSVQGLSCVLEVGVSFKIEKWTWFSMPLILPGTQGGERQTDLYDFEASKFPDSQGYVERQG